MNLKSLSIGAGALLLVTVGAYGALRGAQDAPMGPGPESARLQKLVGTWKQTFKSPVIPDLPAEGTVGTEVITAGPGGFSILTDYEDPSFMGMGFKGHGITTWDATAGKYKSAWTDSMMGGLEVMEGSWDEATKTLTMRRQGVHWMTQQPGEEVHTLTFNADGTTASKITIGGDVMAEMKGQRVR